MFEYLMLKGVGGEGARLVDFGLDLLRLEVVLVMFDKKGKLGVGGTT